MKFIPLLRPLGLTLPLMVFAAAAPTALGADYETPYSFTTLAGATSFGSADGLGSNARFAWPQGLAIDGSGNLYVADGDNSTLRKVTPAGLVSTFAGKSGYYETVNGTLSECRFNFPFGAVVDHAGNIYVAEMAAHVIRKITPAGAVSTFAGMPGVEGTADGAGSDARFNSPMGLVVDSADNLYVTEIGNHAIRKITPAGVVTTFAGLTGTSGSADGTGVAARFNSPHYLAIDATGTFYLCDTGNRTIRKITPSGKVTTWVGTAGQTGSADGTGPAASFGGPNGIGLDAAGNAFVTDPSNHTIRKISPAGVVTTFAGAVGLLGSADGMGGAARFREIAGLVVDPAGNVYVTDSVDCTIRKITPAGEVTTLAGLGQDYTIGSADGTGNTARFNALGSNAVGPNGEIYVADPLNATIRKITAAGVVSTLAGSPNHPGSADGLGAVARFNIPSGVTVDRTGTVYVADSGNNTIRKITPAGDVTTLAGTAGVYGSTDGTGPAAGFFYPYALATDAAGNLYLGEVGNYTIRKITASGDVTTLAGLAGSPGNADGQGRAARFRSPESLAVDGQGNIYVGDKSNNVIRKITPSGLVTTLASTVGVTGQLTADSAGNLFVAGLTIRKVATDGSVSTLAGLADAAGSADGTGSEARFNNPKGIALDSAGALYVASDTTIRKGELAGPPAITTQPQSQTVAAGASVQFSVVASSSAPITYQWYFNGTAFAGATSATLAFSNVRASDAGEYTVLAVNALGATSSGKATLTVTSAPVTPPPTALSGGSGGGGAMSDWFFVALLALGAARWVERRRRDRTPVAISRRASSPL